MNKKPKIAILTLHPQNYGGILSSSKVVYKFCEQYFEPTVFFLGFDKSISTSLRSLKFSSCVRAKKYFGMNCIEIGARWAFWEPGHYKYTLSFWQEQLKKFDYFFVTSGTSIAAHPLILLNKKFTIWLAAPHFDDREQRIQELNFSRKIVEKLCLPKMKKIEKEILHKADFIWALSNYSKKRFEQILGGKRENMVVCSYPIGVRNNDFKYKNLQNSKNIIAVGRFDDPRKNINMLLQVFDALHCVDQSLTLTIVGPKPQDEKLEKFKDLPFFENVIFTGLVDSEKLDEYYNAANLMLITSFQEGLGIIGLEAMLHGIPVVATNCGGPEDYIVNGKNGFLVQVDNVEQMLEKSLVILQNSELAKEMSEFAIQFLKQNFSQEKIYSIFKYGLTKVYPELCEVFEFNAKSYFVKSEKKIVKENRV